MITIGVDIGGTNLRIGCVDKNSNLSNFVQIPQQTVLTGDSPANLACFIMDYIQEYGVSDSVAGVCVGFPAPIDKSRTVVLNAPNISGFNGVNVISILQKYFDIPVFIEKDTNLLLIYDIIRYDLPGDDTIIACYIGTGFGNAIMIDGKLLIGHNGSAGELGHVPAWDCEHECSCGSIGCVEHLAAGKYLTRIRNEYYPDTDISMLFAEHGNDDLLIEYIKHLAIPIVTEVNIIDPSILILGGGVLSMPMFPREKLIESIKHYVRTPLAEEKLKFIFSESDQENGVIGAGICTFKQLEILDGIK